MTLTNRSQGSPKQLTANPHTLHRSSGIEGQRSAENRVGLGWVGRTADFNQGNPKVIEKSMEITIGTININSLPEETAAGLLTSGRRAAFPTFHLTPAPLPAYALSNFHFLLSHGSGARWTSKS